MKKEMSWLTVLVLVVLIAVGLNVIRAADWKYDPSMPISPNNTVQTIFDEVSSALIYVGRARAGTATSAAGWQIYRQSVASVWQAAGYYSQITTVQYYSGDASYNAIWDARAGATVTYK